LFPRRRIFLFGKNDRRWEMRVYKILSLMLGVGLLVVALGGCEQKGPLEQSGKKIDEAVEDLGEAMKKEGPAERAGKKIDETVEKAEETMQDATNR
jgi:predicted small lipoprotein YifL